MGHTQLEIRHFKGFAMCRRQRFGHCTLRQHFSRAGEHDTLANITNQRCVLDLFHVRRECFVRLSDLLQGGAPHVHCRRTFASPTAVTEWSDIIRRSRALGTLRMQSRAVVHCGIFVFALHWNHSVRVQHAVDIAPWELEIQTVVADDDCKHSHVRFGEVLCRSRVELATRWDRRLGGASRSAS